VFNVVGPGQSDGHVCGRFAAQLARRPQRLEVGSLKTTRDFIDVRDVAAALLLVSRKAEQGGVYNVASGRETPIRAVLAALLEVSGLTGQVDVVSRAAQSAGVSRQVADVSRLTRLGFSPRRSL